MKELLVERLNKNLAIFKVHESGYYAGEGTTLKDTSKGDVITSAERSRCHWCKIREQMKSPAVWNNSTVLERLRAGILL